ncbi:hypothetical protein TNCV_1798111 [Trichonephila clavipes]|nr:hypothetical protein TNCV_1798111 [Trichonephila clavipes]
MKEFQPLHRRIIHTELVPTSTQAEYLSMVPTSTQAEYLSMVPTSTQAERSLKNSTSTQVETKFPKRNGGVALHGRLLFTFQTLIKIEIFFNPGLYTGGVLHAEFKPLHRLNEVSKNGGASPSRTLLFIVQTLVQNRNFIDRGRAPIICGR